MQNFFDKNKNSTNPFASPSQAKENIIKDSESKRLNITDMEVLNSKNNSDIEYMQIRMNNLYNVIHNKSQNLDPITLENMKIEWENLRDKIYQKKQRLKSEKNSKNKKNINVTNIFKKGFNKLITVYKLYNPKFKEIMSAFNEINSEVEDLVKNSVPVGEEELKYGMLVNKINQASRLNYKLTNEIK